MGMRFAAILVALALINTPKAQSQPLPSQAMADNCSIALSNTQMYVSLIVVNCDSTDYSVQLEDIIDSINILSKEGKATSDQIASMAKQLTNLLSIQYLVEDIHGRQLLQDGILQKIVVLLAGTDDPDKISKTNELISLTLPCFLQRIDHIDVTLNAISTSNGHVSVFFRAVNYGISEQAIQFFGSHGRRFESSITARGQIVRATGIQVAGRGRDGGVREVFVPGIPLNIILDFDGVYVEPSEISQISLAYSFNTTNPIEALAYRPGCN